MFIAYVACYRGSGRPDRTVVAVGSSVEDVDPMSAHDGAFSFIGVFPTREEAETAARRFMASETVIDDRGFVQWR